MPEDKKQPAKTWGRDENQDQTARSRSVERKNLEDDPEGQQGNVPHDQRGSDPGYRGNRELERGRGDYGNSSSSRDK